MWQRGGDIVTPDGKKSAFGSAWAVHALKLWQESIARNIAPRSFLGGGALDVANLASAYCAMQNVGIWGINALRQEAKDFDYGSFRFPYRPMVCRRAFWEEGLSWPMQKAKTRRKPRSLVSGPSGRCMTTRFRGSLTDASRPKSEGGPRKSAQEKATLLKGVTTADR
jgi:hypothetical protein